MDSKKRRKLYKRYYARYYSARNRGQFKKAHKMRELMNSILSHPHRLQTKEDFLISFHHHMADIQKLEKAGVFSRKQSHTRNVYKARQQRKREKRNPKLRKSRKLYKKLWYQRKRAKASDDMVRYHQIDNEMNKFRLRKKYRKQRRHKKFQKYVKHIKKQRQISRLQRRKKYRLNKSINKEPLYNISTKDLIVAAQINDDEISIHAARHKYSDNTAIYRRNKYVAELSKRFAHGRCQLCGTKMFIDKRTHEPYLESHHIHWLSHGGKDVISNVIALCPNCHRMMHFGTVSNDTIEKLKDKALTYANKYVY